MNTRKILRTLVFVLIFILAFTLVVFADNSEYEEKDLYVNGNRVSEIAYTIKGSVYLSVDTLQRYGDCSHFDFNLDKKRVNFKLADMDLFLGDAETTAFIQQFGGTCYTQIKNFKNDNWVSLNVVAQMARLSYKLDGNKVYVYRYNTEGDIGRVISDSPMFASLRNEDVKLTRGETTFIKGETASFYQLETLRGDTLYVAKGDFAPLPAGTALPDFQYIAKKKDVFDTKINIAWVMTNTNGVTNLAPDAIDGLDVLSPRWLLQNVDDNGDITNFGDKGYVELAHAAGYKVWICLTNSFSSKGSTNYTNQVLADSSLRNTTIAKYLFYSLLYDVDGINVDYEEMKDADREGFNEFMGTLSYYCNRLGLTLSVDVPTPQEWYVEYDYETLGDVCDYVCAMSYDYYYSGSYYAGPVSGKKDYLKGMEKLCNYVPSKKVLMGISLYTALWNTDESNVKQSYAVYKMTAQEKVIDTAGVTPVWDDSQGMYYAEWQNGAFISKMWLESQRSLAVRLQTIRNLGLGGSACWAYGYCDSSEYEIFDKVYKKGVDPSSIQTPY